MSNERLIFRRAPEGGYLIHTGKYLHGRVYRDGKGWAWTEWSGQWKSQRYLRTRAQAAQDLIQSFERSAP